MQDVNHMGGSFAMRIEEWLLKFRYLFCCENHQFLKRILSPRKDENLNKAHDVSSADWSHVWRIRILLKSSDPQP